ncbi:hypothetical protein [Sphingomonas sp.]|uniref:hypothetical protein n=1 Tax=Sphingomonas sp. TaxID=28214 RepID=UPI003569630F
MIVLDNDRYPFGPDRAGEFERVIQQVADRGCTSATIDGRHNFDRAMKVRTPTAFNGREKGLTISGTGQFSTSLVATGANRSGVLHVHRGDNRVQVIVKEMALLSEVLASDTVDNGVMLQVTAEHPEGQPGAGDHRIHNFRGDELFVGPEGPEPHKRGRFKIGIDLNDMFYPKLTDVRVETNAGPDVAEYGIRITGCYDPWVIRPYVWGRFKYGVRTNSRASGETYEGGRVEGGNIVHPDFCVWVDHTFDNDWLYEPGFHLIGNHLNPWSYGAVFTKHRHLVIQGNQFYAPNGSWDRSVPQTVGLWLIKAAEATISGNQFLEPGYYTDDANCSVGIKMGAGVQGIDIGVNTWNTGGIGVLNESQGKNTMLRWPHSKGQRDGQWAPYKHVVDRTGTLEIA